MFKSFFNIADEAASRKGVGYGTALTLTLIALISLGLFIVYQADTAWSAAHRCAGLVFASVTLLVVAHAFRVRMLLSLRSSTMLMVIVVLQLFCQAGVSALIGSIPGYKLPAQSLLWMPYAMAPLLMGVMLGRRVAIFTALLASSYGFCMLPDSMPDSFCYDYLCISLATGIMVAQFSGRVHTRGQVLQGGFIAGITVLISTYLLFVLHGLPNDVPYELAGLRKGFHFGSFASECGSTLLLNFVLASVIGGAMPAFERVFNISTPITWLEWADMNHPLMKKLSVLAPGTFHHCIVVQRLAEAGAEAVGADVTRAGVCALYHDIGKIKNPQYFAENIRDQSNSPHADLTPEASARIITGHVQDGVELATEAGLNRRIVAVIREHHGVSTAYFFFRKAMDSYETEMRKFEEGLIDTCPEPVDKAAFSYKGPIPQTRESGIVSMADAVESATRSLQHPTEDDIRSMIDAIFKGRVLDGHLQDSGLTLGDIAKLKVCFFNTIKTMHHNRIAYPKPKEEDATTAVVEKRLEDKPKA